MMFGRVESRRELLLKLKCELIYASSPFIGAFISGFLECRIVSSFYSFVSCDPVHFDSSIPRIFISYLFLFV